MGEVKYHPNPKNSMPIFFTKKWPVMFPGPWRRVVHNDMNLTELLTLWRKPAFVIAGASWLGNPASHSAKPRSTAAFS